MTTNMSAYCASLQPKSLADNFDAKRLNIESLVPATYGIPTSIVLISVIYTLMSKNGRKEFKGSFYNCFVVTSIIDLITWIHLLLFRELCTAPILDPLFSLIPEAGIIATWAYASQIYFTIAALINPVILSLNRFIGVVFYLKDKQIWQRLSKFIFAFYFLFPIVFSWQLFSFLQPIKKCRIQNFNSTDAYHTFNQQPPFYFVQLASICAYIIFVSGFINVALNLVIIAVLIIRRRQDSSKPAKSRRRVPELKLFFIAFIGGLNVTLEAIYYVAALIFSVINILFWAAIIALLTKYHVSNKIPLNQYSWFDFGISSTFLITSALIILGEIFNQPWLFIPFLFIDCIKLCLVGFSLIAGFIILLVTSGTVIEGHLKEMDASEITVGYAVLIVAFAFIFILDVFWIYSWSVTLKACKHMRIQKNENASLMTGGLYPSKDLVSGLNQVEPYPMRWVTETATAPTA